ncbi:hypothetical protein [Mesobacillus foraminis]|jgi:hypothetical protein|uniref:Uncharacterized protein n=1 Tax=Mesobacillus foraminis TaxID=279826 RepID=A0A4R2BKU4_9BACI|nr:hypothetical protein [Mesobacillus foraminis]TCN27857.1 hypothetical protein EV146_101186 [Mesobacillus foraminis]
MKKNFTMGIMVISIILSFGLHIFGLMQIIPIIITGPVLFLTLFVFAVYLNERHKFKGF